MNEDETLFPDVVAWRSWLDANEDTSDGVWLVLAKAGKSAPTCLTYAQALNEALCSGWIDGQKKSRDADTFLQRFTPRRRASLWSKRNVGLVAELIEQRRVRERGHSEITRAQADGRWDRAYPGAASLEIPDDVNAALAGTVDGQERLAALPSSERFALLLPIITAAPALRTKRIAALVQRFADGPTG